MSVVGIDLGNFNSVIAVARNRGIDVIVNEVSNRATPALVSFGQKQRYLGELAKTQELSNLKNTIGSLKRLLGRSIHEKEILQEEAKYLGCELVDIDGQLGAKVNFQGEEKQFTMTQLMAMYLGKLKNTTETEIKGSVTDVVLSIPVYYTDAQRRALMDAAEIAGLNPLRLMHAITASALQWGITKTDLPESEPKYIAFVDIGQSDCSVSIVAFKKGHMAVKGVAYDRHLGGRQFDEVLVDHFVEEFKVKYKMDVRTNSKALYRLRLTCERVKKILSANSQAPVNVECLMNDKDVSSMIDRPGFEALVEPLLNRIEGPVLRALEAAGITKDQVDAVEIVGGTTRIPAVKQRIGVLFGKDVSTTLNQDECVAKGCTLMCAIISPVFQVREFKVEDVSPYSVKLSWESNDSSEAKEMVAFASHSTIPCIKLLTFYRREPFDLTAQYSDAHQLPEGARSWLGRYSISKIKPDAKGDPATVKVKVKLNQSGIVEITGAQAVEEHEVAVEEEKSVAPMDVDPKPQAAKEGAEVEKTEEEATASAENVADENKAPTTAAEEPAKAKKKTKKVQRKTDLPVVGDSTSLVKDRLNKLRELETQMAASDKLILDTEERRNALEEYVYDLRGKLEGEYSDYVEPSSKETLMSALSKTEDWLYDEGEDATKSVYIEKLNELKKQGDPIVLRFREAEDRPAAIASLKARLEELYADATSADEKFAHIAQTDRDKVLKEVETKQKWLQTQLESLGKTPLSNDPPVRVSAFNQERDALTVFAKPLLYKPKPVVKEEVKPVAKEEDKAAAAAEAGDPPAAADKEQESMDVD